MSKEVTEEITEVVNTKPHAEELSNNDDSSDDDRSVKKKLKLVMYGDSDSDND